MNTAKSIVVALPLPRQLRAQNMGELHVKIAFLRNIHGDFLATPYNNGRNGCIAYLKP